MEAIIKKFEEVFKKTGISKEDILDRIGIIRKNGWVVMYAFSEHDKRAFLQVYVIHRLLNDHQFRIHSSGQIEKLITLDSLRTADSRQSKERVQEFNRLTPSEFKAWLREMGYHILEDADVA